MKKKNGATKTAIGLHSGGLDSTVSIALALEAGYRFRMNLTFDYGQLSARREIDTAKRLCKYYNIPHMTIKLPWINKFSDAAILKDSKKEPPKITQKALSNLKKIKKSAKAVWVPNRNAIFINIAVGIAEALNVSFIITGFNKEEAQTFPDNSAEFIKRINHTLTLSTLKRIKVKSFTINMTKEEIIKNAFQRKVPLGFVWSCYYGENKFCKRCESCMRLLNALKTSQKLEEFKKANRYL